MLGSLSPQMSDHSLSAAAQNRTPTSLGMLARSPLPTLLVNLAKRSLTGTLLLKPSAGGEYGLFLRNGTPTKLSGGKLPGRLGEILVKQGKADVPTLQAAIERSAREGHRTGEILVASGAIDRPSLEAALRTQMALRFGPLGALPGDTVFEFYADLDLLASRGPSDETPVDFLTATTASTRGWSDFAAIDETLGRLGELALTLHPHAAPDRFGFTPPERGILKTMQATRPSVGRLLSSGVDPAAARVVVYALAITRHLDFGAPDSWPMGVRQTSSAGVSPSGAPASARRVTGTGVSPLRSTTSARHTTTDPQRSRTISGSPFGSAGPSPRNATVAPTLDVATRTKEIREREALLGKDHYTLLGVARRANVTDIQAAYFSAAKVLHPDRIPPELESLKPLASKIFSEVSRAHKTLSDPKKRAEYDASLVEPPNVAGEVQRVMLALQAFQRAEALMRKGDFAAAEPLAIKAVEGDENQGQYLALLGWIRAAKSLEELPSALRILDKAVALSPAYDQGHYFRGIVLKRMGREDDAYRCFRQVVELNAHHVDAAREVRLYTMKREERKRTDTGGALGKLFRK